MLNIAAAYRPTPDELVTRSTAQPASHAAVRARPGQSGPTHPADPDEVEHR
jgi:hypothetical protein